MAALSIDERKAALKRQDTNPLHKLCLLIVFDVKEDMIGSVETDVRTLTTYFTEKPRIRDNLDIVVLGSDEILSYASIFQYLESKTRVIFWYIGHGFNMSGNFPTFRGNDIYIEQTHLFNEAKDSFNLFVTVFDCCNLGKGRVDELSLSVPKEDISTMFDFVGKFAICSSSSGQRSWCTEERGGEFTHFFCKNFSKSYTITFDFVKHYMNSDPHSYGALSYNKFDASTELIPRTNPKERKTQMKSLLNAIPEKTETTKEINMGSLVKLFELLNTSSPSQSQ